MSSFEGSKAPRDFHFDLHHPQVLLSQVVCEGHVEVDHEPQRFGFERLQPFEQIVAGALFDAPARVGFRLQLGQLAMEGQTEANSGPIALDERREGLGRERRGAGLARRVDGGVGVQKHGAHEFGPGLVVELDESLQFAQDMRVAEGVIDRVHSAIRQEVVVHDDASLQIAWDVATLFARAIEGEGQARCGVQPMQLAGNPIAGFVEMANSGFGHAPANGLVDLAQLSRLLAHPGHEAGGTDQRRAEQIAQRLRGAILGDELLDVEIDRRRLDALAILSRRDDALGKGRSCFATAVRATMDRGAVFRHLDHALGKIERLPPFRADCRTRVEPGATMAAHGCGVLDNPIGDGDLAKRIASVAFLTAARFARARAQAAKNARLLLQSVARRRLRAIATVQPQPPPKLGVLGTKRFDLALQGSNQLFDFGRKTHSTFESQNARFVPLYLSTPTDFPPPVTFLTHTAWELPQMKIS